MALLTLHGVEDISAFTNSDLSISYVARASNEYTYPSKMRHLGDSFMLVAIRLQAERIAVVYELHFVLPLSLLWAVGVGRLPRVLCCKLDVENAQMTDLLLSLNALPSRAALLQGHHGSIRAELA